MRILRGYMPRRFEAGILWRAGTEKDFVLGVVLLEECRKICFQIRLRSVQWLEQRQRRGKGRSLVKLRKGGAALTKIAWHSNERHPGKDRGSDQAEDGQCEKNVQHAGSRIPAGM